MRLVLMLLIAVATAWPAKAESVLSADQVKEIVRELMREEPELVLQAIEALQERERQAEERNRQQQMSVLSEDLRNQPQDPVLGNPNGEIVIVEFFDYACGFCKRAHPIVKAAVENHGNIRWVMKEFPILGESSVVAARFSLAASKLGAYQAFHDSLMSHRGRLSETAIQSAAADAGLDLERLATVAQEPWISETIARNHGIAQALGISGTPFMFVGDQAVPGFVERAELDALIAKAEN